ncbi:hypothetical protein D5S18_00820 [Nocardia panacis]|uniref:Uncharacterized protein n=2 Tax=Nocardia panacis TaxID=2340916 RepID=A0A3A4KJ04_9NOCA|nr:hypothetical protein D5S18_00820 [Nocardia panacis]
MTLKSGNYEVSWDPNLGLVEKYVGAGGPRVIWEGGKGYKNAASAMVDETGAFNLTNDGVTTLALGKYGPAEADGKPVGVRLNPDGSLVVFNKDGVPIHTVNSADSGPHPRYTVVLHQPPYARTQLYDFIRFTTIRLQLLVDKLGSGDTSPVPDFSDMLTKRGVDPATISSLTMEQYSRAEAGMNDMIKDLQTRDSIVATAVHETGAKIDAAFEGIKNDIEALDRSLSAAQMFGAYVPRGVGGATGDTTQVPRSDKLISHRMDPATVPHEGDLPEARFSPEFNAIMQDIEQGLIKQMEDTVGTVHQKVDAVKTAAAAAGGNVNGATGGGATPGGGESGTGTDTGAGTGTGTGAGNGNGSGGNAGLGNGQSADTGAPAKPVNAPFDVNSALDGIDLTGSGDTAGDKSAAPNGSGDLLDPEHLGDSGQPTDDSGVGNGVGSNGSAADPNAQAWNRLDNHLAGRSNSGVRRAGLQPSTAPPNRSNNNSTAGLIGPLIAMSQMMPALANNITARQQFDGSGRHSSRGSDSRAARGNSAPADGQQATGSSAQQPTPVTAKDPGGSPHPDKGVNLAVGKENQVVSRVVEQAVTKEQANHSGSDARAAYAGTPANASTWQPVDPSLVRTGDIAKWDNHTALVLRNADGYFILLNGNTVPLTDPNNMPEGGVGAYGDFRGFFHTPGTDIVPPAPSSNPVAGGDPTPEAPAPAPPVSTDPAKERPPVQI